MRSRLRLTDSMLGIVIAAAMLAAALLVWQVCAVHAKQHGHDGARPLFDFEGAQRTEVRAKREAGDGRHGRMVAQPSAQKHVRGGRS